VNCKFLKINGPDAYTPPALLLIWLYLPATHFIFANYDNHVLYLWL